MKVSVTTVGLPIGNEDPEKEPMAQDRQGRAITMDLPEEATVADLLGKLGNQGRQVQKVLVNGDDADEGTSLQDGDSVALVGQVTGI